MYQLYKQIIIAAYETYGYLFDYVDPDRNETKHPMTQWIKWFAQRLANDEAEFPWNFPVAQYHQIKIIAADQNYETNFGDFMIADDQLRSLVPAVGYHYNTDDGPKAPYKQLADQYDHEVWYSEGVAPMTRGDYRVRASAGTGIGGQQSGLDIANRLIKSYFKSRRSLYLFQPAVAAYYPGVNYSHKELITAQQPWSGHFTVDNVGLQIIKHFTDFVTCGWDPKTAWRILTTACYSGVGGTENLGTHTDAASYMTFVAPDKQDFSTVFVNDSATPHQYRVNITNLPNKRLYVWQSTGPTQATAAYDSQLKKMVATPAITAGAFTVTVPAYAIITVTTLDKTQDTSVQYQRITAAQPNDVLVQDADRQLLYEDHFDYPQFESTYLDHRGGTPRYLTDQGGAFEVVTDQTKKPILQQMITEKERALDWEYSFAPNFTVGDDRWSDYTVTLAYRFDTTTVQNSPDGNYIGIDLRQTTDVKGRLESAPYVVKLDTNGFYQLLVRDQVVLFDYVTVFDPEKWHQLSFGAKGNVLTAELDGQPLFTWTDTKNPTYAGRVKVGCGYFKTQISQLTVKQAAAGNLVTKRLDNLNQAVTYTGSWQHLVGQRNTIWERTLSIATNAPASFEFDYQGHGFALVSHQKEPVTLQLIIDGTCVVDQVQTNAGAEKGTHYKWLQATAGQHHAKVVVLSGAYQLDAIEILERQV
ncbi:glycosyl hydrolase [Agrilactobacillus fermenti]|uniref:glycosyl hydrolase n=1 Tax=Agrilactobacillus fermenti TaxID=2586909 RepID=UPI003A5BDF92